MTKVSVSLNKSAGSFCGGGFLPPRGTAGLEEASRVSGWWDREGPGTAQASCPVVSLPGEFAVRHEPGEGGVIAHIPWQRKQRTLSDTITGSVRTQGEMLCDTELCITASDH